VNLRVSAVNLIQLTIDHRQIHANNGITPMPNLKTKYAIVGSSGQLGNELVRQGKTSGIQLLPLDLPDFDLTDLAAVEKQLRSGDISLVINAAGYTDVDRAEKESELAFAINRVGTYNLATRCNEIGVPLIHISTDYVFDGKKEGPYVETDPVSPLGVYGRSKAEGESEIRKSLPGHIIIRTSWLYGVHGHNFVKTMLKLGREKETLRVVADQYGSPTSAADLAEAIFRIADQLNERVDIQWGTYNYCGDGVISWHGFAETIFDIVRRYDSFTVTQILPITTAEYPTPASRPANSAMDCSKIKKIFGILPRPWRESLAEVIEALLSK
jgi:dTDP-4-dehydrorhamnose reductase